MASPALQNYLKKRIQVKTVENRVLRGKLHKVDRDLHTIVLQKVTEVVDGTEYKYSLQAQLTTDKIKEVQLIKKPEVKVDVNEVKEPLSTSLDFDQLENATPKSSREEHAHHLVKQLRSNEPDEWNHKEANQFQSDSEDTTELDSVESKLQAGHTPSASWEPPQFFPKHVAVPQEYMLVDNPAAYNAATCHLEKQSVVAVAVLAEELSRNGSACWFLMASTQFIFLFKIQALGSLAISNSTLLGKILSSNRVLKIVHDVRFVSDLFYHKYDVRLNNVFCTWTVHYMLSYGMSNLRLLAEVLPQYVELPVDWLPQYDAESHVWRGPSAELETPSSLRCACCHVMFLFELAKQLLLIRDQSVFDASKVAVESITSKQKLDTVGLKNSFPDLFNIKAIPKKRLPFAQFHLKQVDKEGLLKCPSEEVASRNHCPDVVRSKSFLAEDCIPTSPTVEISRNCTSEQSVSRPRTSSSPARPILKDSLPDWTNRLDRGDSPRLRPAGFMNDITSKKKEMRGFSASPLSSPHRNDSTRVESGTNLSTCSTPKGGLRDQTQQKPTTPISGRGRGFVLSEPADQTPKPVGRGQLIRIVQTC